MNQKKIHELLTLGRLTALEVECLETAELLVSIFRELGNNIFPPAFQCLDRGYSGLATVETPCPRCKP